ncbi:MAG: hypothetical protein WKF40_01920 [Thermoleophilaceae bacterium]
MAQGPAPGGARLSKGRTTMTEITDPSADGELRRIPVADITAEDGFNPRSSSRPPGA